jgi:hypothetical protein
MEERRRATIASAVLFSALAGVLLLSGCGSSSGSRQAPATTGEAVADPTTPSPNGNTSSGKTNPGFGRSVTDLFDAGQPLFIAGEQASSVDDAASMAREPILVPDDSKTGSPEVWVNDETGEVGLRYSTDLVVLQTPWPAGKKVAEGTNPYSAKAESLPGSSLITVSGNPALVIPAFSNKGPDGQPEPPVNTVQVFISGFDLTLMSPTISTDNLLKVAESVKQVNAK